MQDRFPHKLTNNGEEQEAMDREEQLEKGQRSRRRGREAREAAKQTSSKMPKPARGWCVHTAHNDAPFGSPSRAKHSSSTDG